MTAPPIIAREKKFPIEADARPTKASGDAEFGLSRQAIREIAHGLGERRMAVYWTDFLATVAVAYGAWFIAPLAGSWNPAGLALLAVSIFATHRAVAFIHELVHMPKKKFGLFKFAWTALCGVPLLIPPFMYETHMDHHAPRTYGSSQDGEYMPYASLPWTRAAAFIAFSALIGPALVLRFLVLAPLSWAIPQLRREVLARGSALVIDHEYMRRTPAGNSPAHWLAQEIACFCWCFAAAAATIGGVVSPSRVLEAYILITGVGLLNAVRTLVAHRYRGDGEPMTLIEQVLDSYTFPTRTAAIWAPVGLRFHAEHHLFPNLPYHALPEAHRRLMASIPEDSPLRTIVRTSLVSTLIELFGATGARQPQQQRLAKGA